MAPANWGGLVIVIFFVIPGFVWQKILTQAVVTTKRDFSEVVLGAISLSCIVHALFSWILFLEYQRGWLTEPRTQALFALTLFLILFMAPAILGFVSSWLIESKVVRKLHGLWGLRSPIPKAWDFYFRQGRPCWVLVTFKDGVRVGGVFGPNSFASSYPDEEDLYLETVWKVDAKGRFLEPVKDSLGALVRHTDVKLVEFWALRKGD